MSFVWVLVILAVVLIGIGWLQLRLIAYLRRSASRYRWFELFTCVFLVAVGVMMLRGVPRDLWSVGWLWLVGAGCIFSGLTSLEPILRTRFIGSKTLRCSFCNKSEGHVRKLIAGPQAFICDECVAVCDCIIQEGAAKGSRPAIVEEPSPKKPS